MVVIFCFSHQSGDESSQVSERFVKLIERVAEILNLNIKGWDISLLVRKGAHFTIFAVLGLLLFIALYNKSKKLLSSSVYSFLSGSAYAVFDELHQYFVPGRSCQLTDMLIDSSGVLAAVLLCIVITRFNRNKYIAHD